MTIRPRHKRFLFNYPPSCLLIFTGTPDRMSLSNPPRFGEEESILKMRKTNNFKAHNTALFVLSALFLMLWAWGRHETSSAITFGAPTAWDVGYIIGASLPLIAGIVALIGGILVSTQKSISAASKAALWVSLLVAYIIALTFLSLFPKQLRVKYEAVDILISLVCRFSIPVLAAYFLGMIPGISFAILPAVTTMIRIIALSTFFENPVVFLLYITLCVLSQFLSVAVAAAVPFKMDLPSVLSVVCGILDAALVSAILNVGALYLLSGTIVVESGITFFCLVLSLILHAADIFRKVDRKRCATAEKADAQH